MQAGQHRQITVASSARWAWPMTRAAASPPPNRRTIRWTQWIFIEIFDAWYDTRAGRARPIGELVDALVTGWRPTPDGRAR